MTACDRFLASSPIYSFFFIRTSNFGAEAERSYFFHDLRLKMFLRRS